MTYRVEYNHETSGLIAVQAGIELRHTAQVLARKSLDTEGATFARVVNEDSEGEVWSIRRGEGGMLLEG
jgi:hypothetical protein